MRAAVTVWIVAAGGVTAGSLPVRADEQSPAMFGVIGCAEDSAKGAFGARGAVLGQSEYYAWTDMRFYDAYGVQNAEIFHMMRGGMPGFV